MPQSWVALLRGINVGKAKRVAMVDLRAAMESLGYTDVRTLLASGNVVFRSARALRKDAAAAMQDALLRKTGVSSRFTLVSAADLRSIADANPLVKVATNPSLLFVGFLQEARHVALVRPLAQQSWSPDMLAVGTTAFYAWCPKGSLQSDMFVRLSKALGDNVTVRNWGTTTKLLEMVQR